MRRGTTPTLTFTLDDFDYSLISVAQLTIAQGPNDVKVIVKDLNIGPNSLTCSLTEKETLSLKDGRCKVQIKMKLNDDKIVATDVYNVSVKEILNEESL
jgi:hypothetical protein